MEELGHEHRMELTNSESQKLGEALSQIQYDPNGGARYLADLRQNALMSLPKRLIELLDQQRSSIHPRPYFIIENLPLDKDIYQVPHPSQYEINAKSGSISENVIMAMASLVGEPYSISFEGSEIVNNLIPTQESRRDFTGIGSEVELDFHIENAALKCLETPNYSPLGLLLTGVKYAPQGPLTRIADARLALKKLSDIEIQLLRSPLFRIKVPYRWRNFLGPEQEMTDWISVLRNGDSYPDVAVAFYKDMVECRSELAQKALSSFYNALREVSISLEIKPGTLVYIDNRFALHSRDHFTALFDERGISNRWIQRVFVAPNLWNYRSLEQVRDRVFRPIRLKESAA